MSDGGDCRTALATPGLLKNKPLLKSTYFLCKGRGGPFNAKKDFTAEYYTII